MGAPLQTDHPTSARQAPDRPLVGLLSASPRCRAAGLRAAPSHSSGHGTEASRLANQMLEPLHMKFSECQQSEILERMRQKLMKRRQVRPIATALLM